MHFEKFEFDSKIYEGIRAAGYETPTPIQADTIPPILKGRDVLGLAQTGTGKTAAFMLPVLQRLLQGGRRHVRALVIAPTRELSDQIHDSAKTLGKSTGLRSTTIYGGVSINPQIDNLRRGTEIVVACPGRLLDHVGQRTIDLSKVEVLILDEADRMFDMGFLPEIRKIVKHLPAKRQTLLFSATMPEDIRALANDLLTDPVTVQIGHGAPANTVTHALFPVPRHLKTELLLEILKETDTDSVLVFTRTKHRAKKVGQQLERAGYRAASLQGNLSQNKRKAALDGFRNGSYQVLVATDIAARGIDVSSISHVINFDMPDCADSYTHRIGRTGRAAKTGDAFTFITPEDEDSVRAVEKILGERIARRTLKHFDYKKAEAEQKSPSRQPQRPTALQEGGRTAATSVRPKAPAGAAEGRRAAIPGTSRNFRPGQSASQGRRKFGGAEHKGR